MQRGELQLVPVSEVCYLRSDQRYVCVGWSGGQLLIEESLRSLESEFGDRFLRVHRNALVATAYVAGLDRDDDGNMMIRLNGVPERFSVSRRLLGAVRAQLKDLTRRE